MWLRAACAHGPAAVVGHATRPQYPRDSHVGTGQQCGCKPPWHLWVIGGSALLWSAMGAMDYVIGVWGGVLGAVLLHARAMRKLGVLV
jgi:hypothetical protein